MLRGNRKSVILCMVFMVILLFTCVPVSAKTKYIGVWKIKGRTVTYQKMTGVSRDSDNLIFGGKKKTIKVAKNVKCYWFDPSSGSVNNYQHVSKKTFIKRVNKSYNAFSKKYKGKRTYEQSCKVRIKRGKIVAIWGLYAA